MEKSKDLQCVLFCWPSLTILSLFLSTHKNELVTSFLFNEVLIYIYALITLISNLSSAVLTEICLTLIYLSLKKNKLINKAKFP